MGTTVKPRRRRWASSRGMVVVGASIVTAIAGAVAFASAALTRSGSSF